MLKRTIGICMALFIVLSCVQPAFAAQSSPPNAEDIDVWNYTGNPDYVEVLNVSASDVIKVYSSATAATPIATVVSVGESVRTYIDQLGRETGSVFVSVTKSGESESARTEQVYAAETITASVSEGNVTVTNNPTGTVDTVFASGIAPGSFMRVYASATSLTPIGTEYCSGTSTTVNVSQLGLAAGTIYITLQLYPGAESDRVAVTYDAEGTSTAPLAGNITASNYAVGSDTVIVTGLQEADVVSVYATATSTPALQTATVGSGQTSATITIAQLGIRAGSVYVSVRSTGANESTRTKASYASEKTDAPATGTITVTNNYSTSSDTLVITSLEETDVVKVYASSTATSTIGTATIGSGETSATINIDQIGTAAGRVYVTLTKTNKSESARKAVSFTSEPRTTAPNAATITVTNNITGVDDTITVTGLTEGQVVKVYATSSATTALGTATVGNGETSATITIDQLGRSASKVYVTLKDASKLESLRTVKSYAAENTTSAPAASAITVNNYSTSSDTIVVTGLTEGDVVNVFATASAVETIATATVGNGATSATATVEQLGTAAGRLYVSVRTPGTNESSRTAVSYLSEKTTAISSRTVTVTNNYSTSSDTILITGLGEGDVVNAYATSSSTPAIGTATVGSGQTSATITVAQLGEAAGRVYITLTKANKTESSRTSVSFTSEPKATAPTDITVTNNITGVNDNVTVSGLQEGDIVYVYATSSATANIGTATVGSGETSVSITIAQLSVAAGKVYVSIKQDGKLESARTAKAYTAEAASTAPVVTNVTIINKLVGADDTIAVTGLAATDVVKVYRTSLVSDTTVLGTATVGGGETSASISIEQLGTTAGKVYLTVTSTGKNESTRTAVSYLSETSLSLSTRNITATNNYVASSDTIVVTGLEATDVVKVYRTSSTSDTTTLGTVTYADAGTSYTATATIEQLGITAGRVYLTVTKADKAESARTAVSYIAEPKSAAPLATNITISNNTEGTPDTIALTGLVANSLVNVYATSASTSSIGSATVSSGGTATVSIGQLGRLAGRVYITATESGKQESIRVAKAYTAE